MQEEVNEKTIALSVRTARMTASVLKAAMRQFLLQQEKAKQKRNAKAAQKSVGKETPTRGKQTMKQLMDQNSQLTNIEVTDGNIKSFERVARKYQIDFSLKKDASETPPKYIVFFKAKDVDVMTAAFKEFSAKELKKTNKPSLRKRLAKAMDAVRNHRDRDRRRDKDRGQSR